MLFKNKNCKNCNQQYDEVLRSCPHCHHVDDQYELRGYPKSILWVTILRELLLFAIGFIGFQIAGSIMAVASNFLNFVNETAQLTFINSMGYIFTFIALLLVLWDTVKTLGKSFANIINVLYGFAYGVTLIVCSMMYSLIVSYLAPVSDNANQEAVTNMISNYALISILIVGIMGPICEELTYRVGLYSFFRRINKYLAFIITFIVFGLIHFDFTSIGTETFKNELLNLPSYIIAGFILCLAYEHRGPATSIIAHVCNNMFSIIMMLIAQYL